MGAESDEVRAWLGQDVVVDTDSAMIYIGKLVKWGDYLIELEEVDVHDISSGTATKDTYVLSALKTGVQRNRKRAFVRKARVMSVSRLDEVINY